MEAFDQPWKAEGEGGVGAYWGVFDVDRQVKLEFTAPIVRIPEWRVLAGISVTIALLLLGLFYVHSGSLRTRGRTLLAGGGVPRGPAAGGVHLGLHPPRRADKAVVSWRAAGLWESGGTRRVVRDGR